MMPAEKFPVAQGSPPNLPYAMQDFRNPMGKGLAHSLNEHLLNVSRQPKQTPSRTNGPRLFGPGQYFRNRLVIQAGDDRRHGDSGRNAGFGEHTHHLKTCADAGSLRFHQTRGFIVGKSDAEVDPNPCPLMQLSEEVQITRRNNPFGDDAHRIPIFSTDIKTGSRQAERGLQGLITIGIARKHHQFAFPGRLFERLAQQGCRAAFEHDFRLEIRSCSESPILMGWARVTIGTGMKTTPVGIHAPFEREVRAVIPAQNLVCVVLEQLNTGAQRWFKRFALKGFESIGRIRNRFHTNHGAAPTARCQSHPQGFRFQR
ncbi:MAG: hypothetical protein LZF60_340153 [Nitrospira sp.]|nr:MAG: hypothetical protein LZF60_340153 [Nitrospira sp.]